MSSEAADTAAPPPSGAALAADTAKEAGNKQFSAGHYRQAIQAYSDAISALTAEGSDATDAEKNARLPVLYSNRAFSSLKAELYGDALADGTKAIEIDPSFIKAFYRRGSAYLALAKYKDARKEFKAVLKIKPSDPDATAKLDICEKQLRKIAFEAAIASEQTMPLLQKLTPSVAAMTVDSAYKGPMLPEVPPEGVTPATQEQCAADETAVNEHGISLRYVKDMMAWFKDQKMIPKKHALEMLIRLKTRILDRLPSLVHVPFPHEAHKKLVSEGKEGVKFNVAGDTHGQYYDTLNMLEKCGGHPSPTNPFLFNGDFVDRGSFGVENVLTIFAWKLLFPDSVFLNRGNHEQATLTSIYGFKGEVVAKLDATTYDVFLEVFRALPIATVIDKKVFVVHGGLYQVDGVKLDDIAKIDRFREPGDEGLMSDSLWSDPQPFMGRGPSKRGVGQSFGPNITEAFLKDNGLELVIRSHEVQDEGYSVMHNGKLITVFSAPRYCDSMDNKGAVVQLNADCKPSFVVFESVPHPAIRPMAYASGMGMFGL